MSYLRRFFVLLIVFVAAGSMISSNFNQAAALSGSEFQAGRITDDGVFFDPRGMTAPEIQTFLAAKVPSCDTNGTQPYAGTTAAQYGINHGNPPPFTCLKDLRLDTTVKPVEPGICNGYTASNQSAADIIYNVAQSCGINPRMLIVLLQKEQGLVTDSWPWTSQYRSATGYGCPDTAACDSQYYGFFNQVYAAARQFKRYAANPSNFNYVAGRNNNILFSPTTSCGSSTIMIQNQATANLYNYTPYQPNQAALNNLYGTGDSCSSYGNRNFWRYYNDWFGSTFAPTFGWSVAGQMTYSDQTKATYKDSTYLLPGEKVYVVIQARNTGAAVWHNTGPGAIKLATVQPKDRMSLFNDGRWLSNNRVTTTTETDVAPTEIGTFEFWYSAPVTLGAYRENLSLVSEGVGWFNDPGLNIYTNVVPPRYSWDIVGQNSYSDQTKTAYKDSTYLLPREKVFMSVQAKNTGNIPWHNAGPGAVKLATNSPQDRMSWFNDGSWPATNRTALMTPATVAPGQTGTFDFWYSAPGQTGNFREFFNLVAEGITWFNNPGLNVYTVVTPPVYSWKPVSQMSYADQTMTTYKDSTNLHPGEKVYINIAAQNTGNVTWHSNILLGLENPKDHASLFYDTTWISRNRATALKEATVAPGQTGNFGFWYVAPTQPGTYREYFSLVAEGLTWFNNPGLNVYTIDQ